MSSNARIEHDASDPRHGTRNGYTNLKCRCSACCAANTVACRRLYLQRLARGVPEHKHGTPAGYTNYGCRCAACSEASLGPRRRGRKSTAWLTEAMWADYQDGLSINEVAAKHGRNPQVVYCRFRHAGLPLRRRHDVGRTTAMYFDYCTGMSVEEVASKWGTTTPCIYRRFSLMQLPLRPRPVRPRRRKNPNPHPGLTLADANRERTQAAAAVMVERARAALSHAPSEYQRRILQLRIDFPEATLAELGALHDPPLSKDAVSGVLRRAAEQQTFMQSRVSA